ncbi:MAG: hypothetical protein ACTSSE_08630 [Candidatus Thorarchaeota archaeon]
MKPDKIGKELVVIISENDGKTETVRGIVTAVFDDDLFEVTDKWGNVSEWSRRNIIGIKWKGDV